MSISDLDRKITYGRQDSYDKLQSVSLYAHDESESSSQNLKSLKINTDGSLKVDVSSISQSSGIATEDKQDDMIALLQGETPSLNRTKAIPVQIMVGDSGSNYDALRANGQDLMVMIDDMNPDVAVNSGLARSDKQEALNGALASEATDQLRVDIVSGSLSVSDVVIKGNDGNDGAGTDRTIKTSSSGVLLVDGSASTQPVSGTITANAGSGTMAVSASSLPLPSGASTSAKQPALGTAGTASADVISVQGIASMTPLVVDGSASTQPVSASSLPLPSGASTSAKQPALGTAGTASADVISVQGIASMTPLVVDGSASTQPVSGTITANAGSGTFAISASSLPLPSGASTSAKQPALGTAGTASADVISVQGIASMTPLVVDGSATTQPVSGTITANAGSGTMAVSASSLPLPSGASTEATLSSAEAHLGTIDTSTESLTGALYADGDAIGESDNGFLVLGRDSSNNAHPLHITSNGDLEVEIADFVKGQATKANSFPVVLASDSDTLPVEQTLSYSSAFTIINAQSIANGGDFTSGAFEIQSIKNIQVIISLTMEAGGSTNFDVDFLGSIDGTNFFSFPDTTIFGTGDSIVSTEKASLTPVRYMKVKITNNHGSGSHTFTIKGTALGATLATP